MLMCVKSRIPLNGTHLIHQQGGRELQLAEQAAGKFQQSILFRLFAAFRAFLFFLSDSNARSSPRAPRDGRLAVRHGRREGQVGQASASRQANLLSTRENLGTNSSLLCVELRACSKYVRSLRSFGRLVPLCLVVFIRSLNMLAAKPDALWSSPGDNLN